MRRAKTTYTALALLLFAGPVVMLGASAVDAQIVLDESFPPISKRNLKPAAKPPLAAPTPPAPSAAAAPEPEPKAAPAPAPPPKPAVAEAAPTPPSPPSPPSAVAPTPAAPPARAAPVATGARATKTAALEPPSLPPAAKPANCKNTQSFSNWLAQFRKDAAAEGVSQRTISDVLDTMAYDKRIIYRDRGGQKIFTQSFTQFYNKLANQSRYKRSVSKLKSLKSIFDRAEAEFGVPGPVIVAFWALESDFGTGTGNLPILNSLTTLAYDCRRGEMFSAELMAALKLIDRGDYSKNTLVGSWAGEIGQTQFLPGHVLRYAIDYDGDGRSDLYRNNADIIGTSANFVRNLGWRAGEPWLQEVHLTKPLPWEEADLAIKHPMEKWRSWGVKQVSGKPLADGPPASLVLPMGRNGPALFAYPNFDVYTQWNQSLVYALTAAHLATRVAGGPGITHGDDGIAMLSGEQVKELQTLLNRAGWDAGEVDGKLGAGTRAAVKQAQLKFKMPADSYPTAELIAALRPARN